MPPKTLLWSWDDVGSYVTKKSNKEYSCSNFLEEISSHKYLCGATDLCNWELPTSLTQYVSVRPPCPFVSQDKPSIQKNAVPTTSSSSVLPPPGLSPTSGNTTVSPPSGFASPLSSSPTVAFPQAWPPSAPPVLSKSPQGSIHAPPVILSRRSAQDVSFNPSVEADNDQLQYENFTYPPERLLAALDAELPMLHYSEHNIYDLSILLTALKLATHTKLSNQTVLGLFQFVLLVLDKGAVFIGMDSNMVQVSVNTLINEMRGVYEEFSDRVFNLDLPVSLSSNVAFQFLEQTSTEALLVEPTGFSTNDVHMFIEAIARSTIAPDYSVSSVAYTAFSEWRALFSNSGLDTKCGGVWSLLQACHQDTMKRLLITIPHSSVHVAAMTVEMHSQGVRLTEQVLFRELALNKEGRFIQNLFRLTGIIPQHKTNYTDMGSTTPVVLPLHSSKLKQATPNLQNGEQLISFFISRSSGLAANATDLVKAYASETGLVTSLPKLNTHMWEALDSKNSLIDEYMKYYNGSTEYMSVYTRSLSQNNSNNSKKAWKTVGNPNDTEYVVYVKHIGQSVKLDALKPVVDMRTSTDVYINYHSPICIASTESAGLLNIKAKGKENGDQYWPETVTVVGLNGESTQVKVHSVMFDLKVGFNRQVPVIILPNIPFDIVISAQVAETLLQANFSAPAIAMLSMIQSHKPLGMIDNTSTEVISPVSSSPKTSSNTTDTPVIHLSKKKPQDCKFSIRIGTQMIKAHAAHINICILNTHYKQSVSTSLSPHHSDVTMYNEQHVPGTYPVYVFHLGKKGESGKNLLQYAIFADIQQDMIIPVGLFNHLQKTNSYLIQKNATTAQAPGRSYADRSEIMNRMVDDF